ncbi:hypothetical protein BST61_g10991 [Cercospora zeina]
MPLLTNGHANGEKPNVHSADSADDIRAALHERSQREAAVTSRLDTLLNSQQDLNRQLSRLDLARAQLGSQVVAARNIRNGMLSNAASTAHRISGAVKTLDREQAAVKATLEVVEQVAELKACVLGVHGSMGAPQDWETAADYLHRAFNVPDSVIDGAFAEEIVPTAEVPDPPRVTLHNAAESLQGLFMREFEKAEAEGDGARITRFFKLFPLIGRSDVGLEAYGRYVCTGIAKRARGNMSSTRGRDGMFYAQALTKLFEHIAQIVEGHQPLVERHYGPGSMTKVIERIQMEADRQGSLVLDSWSEDRRVHRRLTEIKSYPFNFFVQSFLPAPKSSLPTRTGSPAPGSGRTSEDDSVDMKEIDALLNESAIMLSRWSLYTRFLAGKTGLYDQNRDDDLHLPSFLVDSTLQRKITDLLIDPFNAMATFFFRRSVEKSFQIDEPPSDLTLNPNKQLGSSPPFITSAVDDIMYIVDQVLKRTLSTSQLGIVRNVIPAVGRVLGTDFFGMEQRKMRDESYPKAAIQGALPPENLIISFLVLINNLDVATDYVRRIVRTCLGQTSEDAQHEDDSALLDTFPFGKEAEGAQTVLRAMEKNFAEKTAVLLNEAIEVMLKQVMRPRLRPVFAETFKNIEYDEEGDAAGDDASSDDLVAQRFERGWQAFTLPVKRIATPNVYDKLITFTITHLARTLEKRIWSYYGRVNELGAVRLERDVAAMVAIAVKGGKYELRDAFARCTQMTLILNMEDDEWEEISKLTGTQLERETGIDWKLDADERRRVRAIVKDRP